MTSHPILRAAAVGATPGPWETRGASVHSIATGYIMEGSIGSLSSPRGPAQRERDCAYIAEANPAVVIALLDELDASRAENERLREVAQPTAEEMIAWCDAHWRARGMNLMPADIIRHVAAALSPIPTKTKASP